MKQDTGVSEVIGTIILVVLVTLFVGVLTTVSLGLVTSEAESVPIVSFKQSSSPYYIYHAGGDPLEKASIRIFSKSTDITEKTTINGESWEVWETGDALYLTKRYESRWVTIVGKTSTGREVILFEGMKNN